MPSNIQSVLWPTTTTWCDYFKAYAAGSKLPEFQAGTSIIFYHPNCHFSPYTSKQRCQVWSPSHRNVLFVVPGNGSCSGKAWQGNCIPKPPVGYVACLKSVSTFSFASIMRAIALNRGYPARAWQKWIYISAEHEACCANLQSKQLCQYLETGTRATCHLPGLLGLLRIHISHNLPDHRKDRTSSAGQTAIAGKVASSMYTQYHPIY